MKHSFTHEWRVEIQECGRDGYITYHEGAHSVSFYWEFGGGDIVAIVHIGKVAAWSRQHPWAVDRYTEISRRVIGEVIRQRAPGCKAEVDEEGGYLYLR